MKVLLAEDDENIRNGLAEILEQEGYVVVVAQDGEEALSLFNSESPELICLDIMMPKTNGYDVCRQIRKTNQNIPVMFISAKSEEIDKVLGLELGADDYIVKPFGVKEVVARIRAVTRRCISMQSNGNNQSSPKSFSLSDLEVFPNELRAKRGATVIEISLRDSKILEFFHQNQGSVVDRNAIFNYVWGENYFPASRTVDQHISQLRKRIEVNPQEPQIIKTVHGAGYRYE